MKVSSRLNWIVALIGLWTLLSPFILSFTSNTTAMWDAIILGIVMLVLGVWSALSTAPRTSRMLDWINFIVGILLIISAFVFAMPMGTTLFWDVVLVGLVVAILEIISALSIRGAEAPIQNP